MTDFLHKFLFEDGSVRGELVQLRHTWQEIAAQHQYPPCVMRILGEMTAACALLSANLKFDGSLILQIHGDGPVNLLVVECQTDLTLRATAKLHDGVNIPEDATLTQLVNQQGKGRCVITLDPKHRQPGQQPYQGIVPLQGPTIANVLEHYMRHSEQLHTRLWLAADTNTVAGCLLQQLPREGGIKLQKPIEDIDTWERVQQLAATLTREELLELPSETLMHRLFWQETLQLYEPQQCQFGCSCTYERVSKMLRTLGQTEIEDILAEQSKIEIKCEYCNTTYQFDAVDCAQLFVEPIPASISSSKH